MTCKRATLSSSRVQGPAMHNSIGLVPHIIFNRKRIVQMKQAKLLEQEIRFVGKFRQDEATL